MRVTYVIDSIRTPIGKYAGSLSAVRADDLAALPVRALLERYPALDPASISDVIFGCANQAGEDNRNVARMAALLAGLPHTVPGMTVNRLCASGMSAALTAAQAIGAGEGDLYIAGGVEHMTRSPYILGKSDTPFARSPELFDSTLGWRFVNPQLRSRYGVDSMGETAENIASEWKISREDQDQFALSSQQKTAQAQRSGRFVREIIPVEVPQKKGSASLFEHDEFPRGDSSKEALSRLQPAFRSGGTVTAGNSSGINDGAAALLLASESAVKNFNFKPKARIVASAVVGVEPRIMGIGPVPATKTVLARSGLKLEQMDVIELNEAFAAQALACLRELGLSDDDARVNRNGGAIALGHPLGMSGARLLGTACYELEAENAKFALCTMCVGVGQGIATILERC